MKTDRFVKVLLIIIAGLLLLNCFKDKDPGGVSIPFLETKTKANVPSYIEVGRNYAFVNSSNFKWEGKVLEISKDSGWVKVREEWVNMNQIVRCWEEK